MEYIYDLIVGIIIIALSLFAVVIFIALGTGFYLSVSKGKGFIWQDRNGTAYQTFIKEENGCVYVIDTWGSEVKICGSYRIDKIK